jgi:hypothetical protein
MVINSRRAWAVDILEGEVSSFRGPRIRKGKEECLHCDSPNQENLKEFGGTTPGHRIRSYEKRLKGGAKETLDPFGV